MSNNLFCVSKKTLYFVVLLFLLVFTVFFSLLNNKKIAYKTSANVPGFSCAKIGKYEVQDPILLNLWVGDCQLKYGKTSVWNGSYGSNAICYTQTAICANFPDCHRRDCLTGCLYESVDIGICVANGNPREDPTKYTCPPKGEQPKYAFQNSTTCYLMNGLVAGLDQGLKPYCKPRVVDINFCNCFVSQSRSGCASLTATPTPSLAPSPTPIVIPTIATFLCKYAEMTITNISSPFKWVANGNYKCIQDQNNRNVGYRCKTDLLTGNINANESLEDKTNCPTTSAIKNPYCKPYGCRATVNNGTQDLTYYYMNGRYYSDDICTNDITYKGVGNYCYGR